MPQCLQVVLLIVHLLQCEVALLPDVACTTSNDLFDVSSLLQVQSHSSLGKPKAKDKPNNTVWYHDVYAFDTGNALEHLSLTNPQAAPWPGDPEGWKEKQRELEEAAEKKWAPIKKNAAAEAAEFYNNDYPYMTGDAPEDQLDNFTRYRKLFSNENYPLGKAKENNSPTLKKTNLEQEHVQPILQAAELEQARSYAVLTENLSVFKSCESNEEVRSCNESLHQPQAQFSMSRRLRKVIATARAT